MRLKFDRFRGFVEEYSANLSLGGMFIRTDSPSEVGTVLPIEFRLGEDYELIKGTGRVVWVREEGQSEERPAGMGVRFLELTPGSRELIFKMVERRVREGGTPFDLYEEGDLLPERPPEPGPEAAAREERAAGGAAEPLPDGPPPGDAMADSAVVPEPGSASPPPPAAGPDVAGEAGADEATGEHDDDPGHADDDAVLSPRSPARRGAAPGPAAPEAPRPFPFLGDDEEPAGTAAEPEGSPRPFDLDTAVPAASDAPVEEEPVAPAAERSGDWPESPGPVESAAPPEDGGDLPGGDGAVDEIAPEAAPPPEPPGPPDSFEIPGEPPAEPTAGFEGEASGGTTPEEELPTAGELVPEPPSSPPPAFDLPGDLEVDDAAPPVPEPTDRHYSKPEAGTAVAADEPTRPSRLRRLLLLLVSAAAVVVLVLVLASRGTFGPEAFDPASWLGMGDGGAAVSGAPEGEGAGAEGAGAAPAAGAGSEAAEAGPEDGAPPAGAGAGGAEAAGDGGGGAVAETEAPPSRPAVEPGRVSRVEEITWASGGGRTTLEVRTDAPLAEGEVLHFRLDGGDPRYVIRLVGVEEPYDGNRVAVDSPQVSRLRLGLHSERQPSELHLVLDLTSPRVEVTRVERDGRRLVVVVEEGR